MRDFDAMLADKASVNPTFKVAGQEFTLRAKLPVAKFNKLMAYIRADDTTEFQASEEFFKVALVRADRERFLALLNDEGDDDDAVIDMVQLDAIVDWAMEIYTGKGRTSSDSSSPGAETTAAPSKVVSLNSRTHAS